MKEGIRRIDKVVFDLCDEIYYWKAEAEYYKEQYEKANKDFHNATTNHINHNMKMVGQMLSIALNSEPTGKGLLIKTKKNVKENNSSI